MIGKKVLVVGIVALACAAGPSRGAGLDPSVRDPRNIWFLDFGTYEKSLFQDMVDHGLADAAGGPGASANALAKARLVERILERTNEAYLRHPDGSSRGPGRSFAIAFTAEEPDPKAFPGGAGVDYCRTCIMGGRNGRACSGGTLGAQLFDVGNRFVEWQCRAGRIGVFAGRICGRDSVLSPALGARDLRFLDGSYRLGSGSSQDDARFRAIDAAIHDWGTALGNVVAHEVGHAVGLDHDASPGFIMQALVDANDLSDPGRSFSDESMDLLVRNVGVSR